MAYTPTDWECGQTVTAEKLNNIERGIAEVNSEYTPTTWQCGDLITAEKMNKIEQGIANASGGGGGSSDFSTAEVTIIDNTSYEHEHSFGSLINVSGGVLENGVLIYGGHQKTVTAVLYQNYLSAYIETSDNITATGDIEVEADSGFADLYITGDGTITIS